MPTTFEQERATVASDLRELAATGSGCFLDGDHLAALADLLEFHTDHAALKLARLLAEG